MIKVVLDNNVFVSAVLKPRSNPGRILDRVKTGEIKLFVSFDILSELKTTLLYPKLRKFHGLNEKKIDRYIQGLQEIAALTPGKLVVDIIKDDPSDNIYLACAREGMVDFIVSGDHHLTDLKTFQNIPIVNPAAFLKSIKG